MIVIADSNMHWGICLVKYGDIYICPSVAVTQKPSATTKLIHFNKHIRFLAKHIRVIFDCNICFWHVCLVGVFV